LRPRIIWAMRRHRIGRMIYRPSPGRGAAGTTIVPVPHSDCFLSLGGVSKCFSDVQALDADDAGRRAMPRVGNILGRRSVSNIIIVDVDQLAAIVSDGSPRAVAKEV
jgi:hypothetical protein